MIQIIKRNIDFIKKESKKIKNIDKKLVKEIVMKLQKNKLVTITGLKGIGKTKIISYIIFNSNIKDSFLYINKSLDFDNKIKNIDSLKEILEQYRKNYNNPKVIILEDIALIEGIKNYINFLYNKNYKIIIISNNITISDKPEIEIKGDRIYNFGLTLEENKYIEKLKTKNIIFEEIIKGYAIKNFDLYNYTLSFLSFFNKEASIREINRKLNENIKVSLITMMEYLKYSINAKLLKQIYTFDFKKEKEINSKTKHYFTNTQLRNSVYNFELDEKILKENFLFNQLDKSGYNINSGTNGSYNFKFYCNKKIDEKKTKTMFIDFCISSEKKEIKKQIKKLLKVPNVSNGISNKKLNQEFIKYMIIENIEEIGIKKLEYENLKIIKFNDLLKEI